MPSDLPTLIARLREARPELADRLPEYRTSYLRWTIGNGMDRHELPEVVVERILIGVCAEWIQDEYDAAVMHGLNDRDWVLMTPALEIRRAFTAPDFPSALVEAVIGEGRE